MCQGLLELEAARLQWSTPLGCRKLLWTPDQKQWHGHALQPPSDLIKSTFSYSAEWSETFWSERWECSSVIAGEGVWAEWGWVKACFCVCISPYIEHIHTWWYKIISLFSSVMFICSENCHQGTQIYCSCLSSWGGGFKAHCVTSKRAFYYSMHTSVLI